jgi:type VI secretion system secreted protein VgrG
MEISSSANLSVSAQTELTQKAMMVDIKANAKGTLSAGAMLEVKGGLVKIN